MKNNLLIYIIIVHLIIVWASMSSLEWPSFSCTRKLFVRYLEVLHLVVFPPSAGSRHQLTKNEAGVPSPFRTGPSLRSRQRPTILHSHIHRPPSREKAWLSLVVPVSYVQLAFHVSFFLLFLLYLMFLCENTSPLVAPTTPTEPVSLSWRSRSGGRSCPRHGPNRLVAQAAPARSRTPLPSNY